MTTAPPPTTGSSSLVFDVVTTAISSLLSTAAEPTTSFNTSTTTSKPAFDDENNGECKLLGPFAVLVQAALGALALLSLVFKRWRERPQRPLKIWAFDASKQVFGSVLLHLANLFMAMFSAGQLEQSLAKAAASAAGADIDAVNQPNPCSFYLLNLAIDTTIGIPILIAILRILTIGASYTPLANPPESIKSGNYGDPPRAEWWLKQSIIYFIGLLGMKTCVFFIFQLCPWIVQVGDWALRWTEGNEAIQIAFVMLIFPLIMNALQYYIIDTFIKKPSSKGETEDRDRGGNAGEQSGLLSEDSGDQDNSQDEVEIFEEVQSETSKPGFKTERIAIYDPDTDKPTSLDVAESSSSSNNSYSNTVDEGLKDRPRI